jgi:hypothetical protein
MTRVDAISINEARVQPVRMTGLIVVMRLPVGDSATHDMQIQMPATFATGILSSILAKSLEDKLRAQLHRSRIAHASYSSVTGERDVKSQGGEVCMVKNIKDFPPQLK